uniref:Pyroglutamyl-peptidase I n=1 Tax=Heliothis virescens TaxID=7102 RepID=A0A2A4JEV0_HELVI
MGYETNVEMKSRLQPTRVLITGFGPFRDVPYNISWPGVLRMDKNRIECENNVILLRNKINVDYDEVDSRVPELWRTFKPHLAIHVGVAENETFRLETHARNANYRIPDKDNKLPRSEAIVPGGCPVIHTIFNVTRICEEFNKNPPASRLGASISENAGLFICEYIYYSSLLRGPTLFVHVPLMKYTEDEIAEANGFIAKINT